MNSFKDTGNRGRGIFTGGEASGGIKAITFVNVSTQGNAVSFGRLKLCIFMSWKSPSGNTTQVRS